MRHFLLCALALVVSANLSPAMASPETAGEVGRLQGQATARLDEPRDLAVSDALFRDEELSTGPAARLEALLLDGSVLTLGGSATLTLDEMVYDPAAADGSIVLSITSGAFRLVSGGIARTAEKNLKVITPVGTIGIRGTDFWGLVSADRLDLALLDDTGVYVTNNAGTFELTEALTTFTITSADAPPLAAPRRLTDEELAGAVQTIAFEEE